MDLQLKDKCALVTGASRGLGYATALGLAREGCRVAINSRDEAKLKAAAQKIAQETGTSVVALAGDVTDASVPEKLIKQAVKSLGRPSTGSPVPAPQVQANGVALAQAGQALDILITNAGGPPSGAFESFDEAAWQKAIDLSFMSHVRLIRAALPYLRKSGAASVLTFTSYSVKQPIPNLVLSNSVRAATVGLTKTLALELGKEGIRFNSILPSWTETERITELMAARAEQNGTTIEEEIAKQSQQSALGRMSRPEEFANAAVFLVSPVASYITGVMLTVDGGMYKGTL